MAKKIIKAQMKQRRDTLENWAAVNPVLLDGELGFIEGFNDRFKVGDGKTAWNDLSYFSGSFDPSGTYPDLTAGDLAGRGESVPASFGFRASGGKSIKDGRAYIKRIKGNSVVWNNYLDIEKISVDGGTMSRDGNKIIVTATGKFPRIIGYSSTLGTLPKGNVVLITFNADKELRINFPSSAILGNGYANGYEWQLFVVDEYDYFTIYHDTESYTVDNIRIIDLTKMFQAGNEPSTIEEFNARVATLGINPYAYNEGQVIHCNTERIKSVGDNAVSLGGEILIASTSNQDEVKDYQVGYTYVGIASSGYANADRVSKCEVYDGKVIVDATSGYGVGSFLEVLPNAEYHINASIEGKGNIYIAWYDAEKRWIRQGWFQNDISPYNARYAMCCLIPEGSVVFSDIMLTLVHSGWKQDTDAGYRPYWQDTLPLPIIRKYFPQGMKLAGTAHDEIRFNKASGKWEYSKGRIKSVDLGTFDYTIGSTNLADSKRMRALTKISDAVVPANDAQVANILCGSYIAVSSNNNWQNSEGVCISADGYLYVYDKEKQDAASFKAAMAGVILYYEAAEWEWVELDAEDQNFRDYYQVADFGTEQAIPAKDAEGDIIPSAAFSADIIYQFNAVDMIREHEMEINELQSIIATMQAQLTSLINQ